MKVTQLYTDASGESHFEEIPTIMEEKTDMGFFSDPQNNVKYLYFQNTLPHQEWDFRHVSNKIYIVILEGEFELEVSTGEKRRFMPGDVILLADHSGKGHKAKTFDNTVGALVVHLN